MKSIGLLVAEDTPDSQNLFIYILEHPSRQERRKIGLLSSRSGMAEGEGRIGANGPLVDHSTTTTWNDQLFSTPVVQTLTR